LLSPLDRYGGLAEVAQNNTFQQSSGKFTRVAGVLEWKDTRGLLMAATDPSNLRHAIDERSFATACEVSKLIEIEPNYFPTFKFSIPSDFHLFYFHRDSNQLTWNDRGDLLALGHSNGLIVVYHSPLEASVTQLTILAAMNCGTGSVNRLRFAPTSSASIQ
jgi:hypothetical protein